MQCLRLNLNVENCESFDQCTRRIISTFEKYPIPNSWTHVFPWYVWNVLLQKWEERKKEQKMALPTPKPTNKIYTKSFHHSKLKRVKEKSERKKIQYYMHVLHMHGRIEALWSGLFAECKIPISHLRWEHRQLAFFFFFFP